MNNVFAQRGKKKFKMANFSSYHFFLLNTCMFMCDEYQVFDNNNNNDDDDDENIERMWKIKAKQK
jgi:hypothetical protein